jgi:glycosyltransferase involved in cell wall biosynthesis
MVLFLHNRYRTTGGEERAVEDLLWLVREQLHERAELLTRSSAELSRRRAALGLLRGGLDPDEVARAVGLGGARVVHAHNLQPSLGWRALAAARAAGARVVLHLHQYRLVCAIGVCFTRGADCTRCHGRDTLPSVRLNCRASRPEAAAYAASLALWQRRLVEQADVLIVPSAFARERLRELGAPLPWERVHVLAPPVRALAGSTPTEGPSSGGGPAGEGAPAEAGSYALVVSRLAPEKGVDVAIDACREAGIALVIAGDGPERAALEQRAATSERAEASPVRFAGRVDDEQLARLRAGASIALVPSRAPETFGLAAAEAMAAGLPVAASRVGALPELVDERGLVTPGDPHALAGAIAQLAGDRSAGELGLRRVRERCAPEVVAGALAELYEGGRPAESGRRAART